jgi:uncharacterized RDD family membrane protein YckC
MVTRYTDQFVLETPENISFGYEVAGIGSRFLAALIDTLIQFLLYFFLSLALVFISATATALRLPTQFANWLGVLFIIALFLIQFGYFMFLEIIMNGQTPGKRLFHLRVIKENGYPLGVMDSVVRNLIRIIDFFPFGYGIGIIAMFLNDRAKRLGDFGAGTIVVKLRDQIKLAELSIPASTGTTTAAAQVPGLERLKEPDIEVIESYLRRRTELKNANVLGPKLATQIRARLNSHDEQVELEPPAADDFLRTVVAAYRKSQELT